MDWVKCSDETPVNGENVLMSYNNLVMEGEYSNGKFYYPSYCAHVKGYCKCEEQEGITHWMPLPKPPSAGDEILQKILDEEWEKIRERNVWPFNSPQE